MRTLIFLSLLVACTSADPAAPEPSPHSVREHLAEPTRFVVAPGSSGGAITAKRWSHDGWIGGDVPLVIDSGAMGVRVDVAGRLIVTDFQVALAPIVIPESAIGTVARLDHLRLDSKTIPVLGPTTWDGQDAATTSGTLDLVLSWAVTVDETTTTLGPQHLPPIKMELDFGGDGATVDATVALSAMGTLWGWAGLIDISDLRLVLDASSRSEP